MMTYAFRSPLVLLTALSFGAAARGDFQGRVLDVTSSIGPITDFTVPGPASTYFALSIWIAFDDPSDRLLGIQNANIQVLGSPLFQHPFGSAKAPPAALFGLAPALPYDSFVTIGLKSIPLGGSDSTVLESASGFTGPGGTRGFVGGWHSSNPDNDQGAPGAHGAPEGSSPSLFYVLVAQLGFRSAGITYVNGSFNVMWKSAEGATITSLVSVGWPPAPGTLALFCVAGLNRARRRTL